MRYYKLIFLSLIICACNSNQKNSSKLDGQTQANRAELTDKRTDLDWNCSTLNGIDICLPNQWIKVDQDNFEQFYFLEDTSQNDFFVLIKYDLDTLGLSPKEYCQEVYRQLLNDPNEPFKKYSFREVKRDGRSMFFGEFITEVNHIEYLTYTFYSSLGEKFYDISLKSRIDRKAVLYDTFHNIIYNLKVNDNPLFKYNKAVDESIVINFDNW